MKSDPLDFALAASAILQRRGPRGRHEALRCLLKLKHAFNLPLCLTGNRFFGAEWQAAVRIACEAEGERSQAQLKLQAAWAFWAEQRIPSACFHQFEKARALNLQVFILGEPDYPACFDGLKSPPPFIFYRGNGVLACLNAPFTVGMVGTRHPTGYGLELVNQLTQRLVEMKIPIISGMAYGIDRQAHEQSLRQGGLTLAWMAHGLDDFYPRANRDLLPALLEQGGVVSCFGLEHPPKPAYFPARNRLIAASSSVLVIPEAGLRSGSLITASQAAEMGRPVLAVPGSIFSPNSLGTNQLISEGAIPLCAIGDLLSVLLKETGYAFTPEAESVGYWLSHLPLHKPYKPFEEAQGAQKNPQTSTVSPQLAKVLESLAATPKTLEGIRRDWSGSIDELMLELTEAELAGLIFLNCGRYSVTALGRRSAPRG